MYVLTSTDLNPWGSLFTDLLSCLSSLWYSILLILVALVFPDSQLYLSNLKSLPGSASLPSLCAQVWKLSPSSMLRRSWDHLACFPSLIGHYPSLSNVWFLKNVALFILSIFCFRWEDKFAPCYSTLTRCESHMNSSCSHLKIDFLSYSHSIYLYILVIFLDTQFLVFI